jgi:DNA-binding transcriptional LysR family regulator
MELRQLELFVAVAEERQFTRAAHRCHIGQSALSSAIRSLEHDLGETLFIRTTRRVDLTQAGLALLTEARRTLVAASAAREAVRDVGTLLRGSLSVGGVATTGTLDQAALLAEFRRRHPGIEIHYVRSTTGPLLDDVRLHRLDVAFVTLTDQPLRGVRATPLVTEPLMFLCRSDHPLADHAQVSLEELTDEVFVGAPPGTVGGEWLRNIFDAAKAQPPMPFLVSDVSTMLEFVASGLGVTLVQRSIGPCNPDLRAIPLSGAALAWTLGIVTPLPDRVSRTAQAFVDLVHDSL